MENSRRFFNDSDDDVQIVEEVIVVDVVHNDIPQDQFDEIVVIGESVEEAEQTCTEEASETCLENKLKKFTLQDHDYTANSSKVYIILDSFLIAMCILLIRI
jgi:hypothetical protein